MANEPSEDSCGTQFVAAAVFLPVNEEAKVGSSKDRSISRISFAANVSGIIQDILARCTESGVRNQRTNPAFSCLSSMFASPEGDEMETIRASTPPMTAGSQRTRTENCPVFSKSLTNVVTAPGVITKTFPRKGALRASQD